MLPTTAKLHAHPAELAAIDPVDKPSVDTRKSFAKRTMARHLAEMDAAGPGADRRSAALWVSRPGARGRAEDPTVPAAAGRSRIGLAHQRPRQDVESRVDIVTGQRKPKGTYLRRSEVSRVRPSQNRAFSTATQEAALDLITGRVTRRVAPPAESKGVPRGRAIDRPPLGTLSAVRPLTPKGTDYYAAFRQGKRR